MTLLPFSRSALRSGPVEQTKTGTGTLARIPPPARLALALLALLIVWYGVIGTIRAGIEVDLSIRPERADLSPGGSVTVGMAARLLTQQVAERAFTPNDPVFYPTGLARRTPAFQKSLVVTLAAAIDALAAETPSAKLAGAATALQTDPALWWIRAQMPPVGRAAERHLLDGRALLRSHNLEAAALASQADAPRQPRLSRPGAAALAALLEMVEAEAERGDRLIRGTAEGSTSVQIARARGTAYAATLVLRGLREDNAASIRLSGRASRWSDAQDALDRAAVRDPVFASHSDLIASGYDLLVAASAMRAILAGQV
jgi:hypothetical protein